MKVSDNVVWHHATVTRQRRERLNGHRGGVIWFTGLSGSGKSTLGHAVEEELHRQGCRTIVLDGDNMRHGLCGDLGFSEADRHENIRRIGEVAKLFVEAGESDFLEVYCRCPVEVCESRDVKGLYAKARAGIVTQFTGVSAPYEAPANPDLAVDTDREGIEDCVRKVLAILEPRLMPGRGGA